MQIKINNQIFSIHYTELIVKVSLTKNKYKLTIRTPTYRHSISKYFIYNSVLTACIYEILSWCSEADNAHFLDVDEILEKYLTNDNVTT